MKTDNTIAVVGASARAAAFSLLRAKRQVVAADLFADADLHACCPITRVSPYPEGLAAWLAKTKCDAWLYTGALENYPDLVDHMAVLRPLLGHAGEQLRRVRDPLRLQNALIEGGLPFPETKASTHTATESDWLRKTCTGSCGSGVGIERAKYLQRRIEGTPLSAIYHSNKLLGVTRQLVGEAWTGAAEFKYCGTIAPWPVPPTYQQQLIRLGELMCSKFQLTELYGVDLIDDGRTLWTIEVNPRYTAAVEALEQATNISILTSQQQLESVSSQPIPHPRGKAILYAKAPIIIDEQLHTQLLEQGGQLPWPDLADIPNSGTAIETGQPVLTLFATANSCETVSQRLQQRAAEIEQLLYVRTFPCA